MEEGNLFILAQLINMLDASMVNLEKSYNRSDKESFESAKKAILEIQSKINTALKRI